MISPEDLHFILKQIDISERHAWRVATQNTPNASPLCSSVARANPDLYFDVPAQMWFDVPVPGEEGPRGGPCVGDPRLPHGLRTVDGRWNNLMPGQSYYGAADQTFPRLLEKDFRDADPIPPFAPVGPGQVPGGDTSYAQDGDGQFVYDAEPRIISNLIVDQSVTNPAAVAVAERTEDSFIPNVDGAIFERIAGADRYATAAAISRDEFEPGVDVVYIATGQNFPDALAAASAAVEGVGPILLVRPGSIPEATATELERLEPQRIVVVGGTTAVSAAVATQLDAFTTDSVTRLAGPDRYATAADISNVFDPGVQSVYIATGQNFPDALTGGAAAAARGAPVLLVRPGSIPDVTAAALNRLQPQNIVILGGATVVNAQVATQLQGFTNGSVQRLSGDTRYLTAVAVSQFHYPTIGDQEEWEGVDQVFVATGQNFPDALAVGAVAGLRDAPVLLVPSTGIVPPAVIAELLRLKPGFLTILGGNAAVSADVEEQLRRAFAAEGQLASPDGAALFIPNEATDEALSAPFSGWMTLFGQFFDHGLDLVQKGGNGTIVVPLQPDDPLYDPESNNNFLMLTRATNEPGVGDGREHRNRTTPFIDQNQTYTSHASHQVFLREYELVDGAPVPTGYLLNGADGGLATWLDVKEQAANVLGIALDDWDVVNVPLLVTDPYGRFVPGANGFPQVVIGDDEPTGIEEGSLSDPVDATDAVKANHSFLDDIAHSAAPFSSSGDPLLRGVLDPEDELDELEPGEFDGGLLDDHFITGDGRGNENLGLTAVHHVFHSEHNRLVDHIEAVLADTATNPDYDEELQDLANRFAKDGFWDYSERLFQAARFVNEMEYQHLAIEEFIRTVQPAVDAAVLNESTYHSDINPAIVAEFAHVVYRFGHSMLTETIDREFDGEVEEMPLFDAFLNPRGFHTGPNGETLTPDEAAGSVARGMTDQVGNAIDEFVTDTLRNQLLGLPLDLASINIMRGRDTGIPTLQAARAVFFESSQGSSELEPYSSWRDFELSMRNRESIVNFVAAYGIHPSLESATTITQKRAAAEALVADDDFMFAPAAETGLDTVDLWMGGLAEKPNAFGGMLGSTFNVVFEVQMENLQNGDRFYYLTRNHGQTLFHTLEANSFSELISRNTDADRLPFDVFAVPGEVFDLSDSPAELVAQGLFQMPDGTWRYDGEEHIVMYGTDGDDRMQAGIGDDALWGYGGNDRLEGGEGVDAIIGGDGDDIITDLFMEETILGGAGNDAINGGPGIDLILAGSGNDFVVAGSDETEIFGGLGNDFILGSDGRDFIWGNEGDDWIEGGGNADLLQGDNGNGFQNDWRGGHDVILGISGNNDYEGEGGDDILVAAPGTQRFEGMLGFDWVTYKGYPNQVDADMMFHGLMPPDQSNLRSRFDMIEGLSGWDGNDVLRGMHGLDDAVNEALDPTRGLVGYGHSITQEHLDRVAGLRDLLGGGANPPYAEPFMRFPGDDDQSNNILLGGGGSDIIEPREGVNFVDGDAWLNVRVEWRPDGGPVESQDRITAFTSRVFSGEINPGDLHIVREILTPPVEDQGVDTLVLYGLQEHYELEDLGDGVHVVSFQGDIDEEATYFRNVERIQYNDVTVCLVDPADCGTPEGEVVLSFQDAGNNPIGTPVEGGRVLTDLVGFSDPDGTTTSEFYYALQFADPDVDIEDVDFLWTTSQINQTGTFRLGPVEASNAIRVVVTYVDDSGVHESLASASTPAPLAATAADEPPVVTSLAESD